MVARSADLNTGDLSRRTLLKGVTAVSLGGLAFGGLAACGADDGKKGSGSGSMSKSKATATIRLSYGQTIPTSTFYIAHAKKFYEKWDVRTTQNPLPSSPSMLQGIAGGSLDTASAVALTSLPAFTKGVPINMIFPYVWGGAQYAIAVTPKSGIKSVKDLEGKRVAVTVGIAQEELLILAMRKAGADYKSIKIFNMKGPTMAAALASNAVDAAVGIDPDTANWIAKGIAMVIESGDTYFSAPGTFCIRRSLIEDHPEDVYRLTLAIADCWQWIRKTGQTSDEVVSLASTLLNAPKDLTKASMKNFILDTRITPAIRKDITTDGEFVVSQGRMAQVPDLDKFIVPTFIDRAQKEHPELFDDIPDYLESMGVDKSYI